MYLAASRPIQIIYSMCFFQGVLGTSSVGCHQMSSESAILTALSSESMISITVDVTLPATRFASWGLSTSLSSYFGHSFCVRACHGGCQNDLCMGIDSGG